MDAQGAGALERAGGQLRLGGELPFAGDLGEQAPLFAGGPGGGQVRLPVDHRVAEPKGIGEVDGDLT